MKHCMLLALMLGCVHGAQDGMEDGSCKDGSAMGAAGLALSKINLDRTEGYIFALHRLSNVHMAQHGENGTVFYPTLDVVETNCSVLSKKDWKACEARPTSNTTGENDMVFYLTLDVVETNCSVLSKKDWKACEARDTTNTPVYGQCKAAIYISKVHRVERLYKYNCIVRPAPPERVYYTCPDCPSLIGMDDADVQEVVSRSLEKFNREGGLTNRFALLKVARPSIGGYPVLYYIVEYTIQETTCLSSAGAADPCPLLECEFTHRGFCKASLWDFPSGDTIVECEIYEPECAEGEKKGTVRVLPAMGQAVILPCRGSRPGGEVTLPLKEDPQIPGQMEPTILPFPMALSANCSLAAAGQTLVENLFSEDPMFKQWWFIWAC